MKKQIKIIIVLAVALLIIIGIVGFLFYYNKTRCIGCAPVPKNLDNLQSQNTTAGSKNYQSVENNFEFTYPNEWKISERKIQNGLSIKLFPDSNSNKGSLTISIETKPYSFCKNCQTLDEVVNENIKILQTTVQEKLVPHEGKIDGNRFVEINYRTSDGYQGDSSFFIVNEKLYTVSYFELSDIANRYEDKYREIVKSFKLQ